MSNQFSQPQELTKTTIQCSFNAFNKKLTVFMAQKLAQTQQTASSSQHFRVTSNHRIKQHLKSKSKVSTICFTGKKWVNLSISDNHVDDSNQRKHSRLSQILQNQRRINNHYRIKSYTTINDSQDRKLTPLILKFMKETFKNEVSKDSKVEVEEQSKQLFGLNIQQVKTYKVLNKKQRLNLKYAEGDQYSHKRVITSFGSQSLEIDKNNPVKGGGFNIMAVSKRNKNHQLKGTKTDFLKTIINRKESFPESFDVFFKKRQNTSAHNWKILKMMNCLDIILSSFHLRLSRKANEQKIVSICEGQGKPSSQKFTYFIGKGNNAELIRSIFNKRGWWTETNSFLKANFVWSQIKIKKVINKQATLSDQSMITFYYQNDRNCDKQSNLFKKHSRWSINQIDSDKKVFDIHQKAYQLLFHQKQSKKYYLPLSQSQKNIRLQTITCPQSYHNHFQFNHLIGNKNALYFHLRDYFQFCKKNLCDIVPLTYYLENGSEKTIAQFQKQFQAQPNNIWILKPGQNSNRGQRIVLSKSLEEIKAKLKSEKKLIVQSYIKNILLYNGRKFDIRTYLVAINFHGRLKFYFYEEGYIKTSSFLYNLKNINDKFIHLTNDAIQQTSDKYGKYEQGNKLSYGQFQRYLDSKHQKDNYNIFDLHQIMRSHASQAVKATYHKLNPIKRSFCFELFGLDFLVDSSFKPYLIQVNTNPCLELCSPSLERLIPRMMENLFRLCVDPLFRPQFANNTKADSYYFYDEQFLEKNQFRLIFDQKFDQNSEWEKYSMDEHKEEACTFSAQEEEQQNLSAGP